MCLITVGPATKVRTQLLDTPRMLDEIFWRNRDGFGVMYYRDDLPFAARHLPKNVEEARAWLDATLPHGDTPVAVHARFATHGAVQESNLHPFPVDDGFLMHNGILSATTHLARDGNSDTWHFCRLFLDGETRGIFGSDKEIGALGDLIGDNRFVFLGADGKMAIVNEEQGITHDEVWYSNLYAWDPGILDPRLDYSHGWGYLPYRGRGALVDAVDFAYCVAGGEAGTATELLDSNHAGDCYDELMYRFRPASFADLTKMDADELKVLGTLLRGDVDELVTLSYQLGSDVVVETLAWCVVWDEIEIEDDEPPVLDAYEEIDYAPGASDRALRRTFEMTDVEYAEMYSEVYAG